MHFLRLPETICTIRVVARCAMTKTLTANVQRMNAERQLFGARRALGHLVELYESGQLKSLYKEVPSPKQCGKRDRRLSVGPTSFPKLPKPDGAFRAAAVSSGFVCIATSRHSQPGAHSRWPRFVA